MAEIENEAHKQAEERVNAKLYELGLSENGKILIEVLKQSAETAIKMLYRNKQLKYEEMIQIAERARTLENVIFILQKKPEIKGGT
jgi:hypothetical protein